MSAIRSLSESITPCAQLSISRESASRLAITSLGADTAAVTARAYCRASSRPACAAGSSTGGGGGGGGGGGRSASSD